MTKIAVPKEVKPIFIVGAPRSGTTMLAAMIGSHSHYGVGPESQFFSKLSPTAIKRAVADPEWPKIAVGLIAELTLAEQRVIDLFGAEIDEITEFLTGKPASAKAMLEALTVPFAAKRAKPGWAEKTPNHLLNLPAIREYWPDARIIRIMRDPRDAAISTCRLPSFSGSFAANIYMWRSWQDQAKDFFDGDENCYTIRYENLVENPEQELAALCEFLAIPFEDGMLDFSQAAGDVSSAGESWKKPVSGGLTRDRMFAWKKVLGQDMQDLANDVTYEYLVEFDYEHGDYPAVTQHVFRMSREFIERHQQHLTNICTNGRRWLPSQSWQNADIIVEQAEYKTIRKAGFLLGLARGKIGMALGHIIKGKGA